MARDKARDDKFFNCEQEHEDNYVSNLYGINHSLISVFLKTACENNTIKYSTHTAVYELIKTKLGFSIPT